jgi:hypothetical protein
VAGSPLLASASEPERRTDGRAREIPPLLRCPSLPLPGGKRVPPLRFHVTARLCSSCQAHTVLLLLLFNIRCSRQKRQGASANKLHGHIWLTYYDMRCPLEDEDFLFIILGQHGAQPRFSKGRLSFDEFVEHPASTMLFLLAPNQVAHMCNNSPPQS